MKPLRSFPWLPVTGTVFALLLLAGAVVYTRQFLRVELRAQLARRDAMLVSSLLNDYVRKRSAGVADELAALIEISDNPDMPGVRSLSSYDTNGMLFSMLSPLGEDDDLPWQDMEAVKDGKPLSRFGPASELDTGAQSRELLTGEQDLSPVLQVVLKVPKEGGGSIGYARFVLDGKGLAAEYAELDDTLWWQAFTVILIAGVSMTVGLSLVFRRLSVTQRHLVAANRELTLAAKTAAVGAVTSHLIHGLKNPLAGLQQFVAAGAGTPSPSPETVSDWLAAMQTTQRMRSMIDAVTGVLREDAGLVRYEVTPREVLDQLELRETPAAREAGVRLAFDATAMQPLPNRDANLILLILENLVRNAIQASPVGGCVRIRAEEDGQGLEFRVRDEGPGLPAAVRASLFTPVVSTKEGGTGLGLALSQQLARSLGARLDLAESGKLGTEFVLRLPRGEGVVSFPGAVSGSRPDSGTQSLRGGPG
ncbi:MAG: HAMP domain-containing histidine kinase [Verrucomicrobiae bacterium]|nr:HAMP domain-containing histidine kinase [Verrucomicrobiae bacterium]